MKYSLYFSPWFSPMYTRVVNHYSCYYSAEGAAAAFLQIRVFGLKSNILKGFYG
jgi:hypothetical protein